MKSFFLATLLMILAITPMVSAQDFHMPQASPTVTVNQGFSTSFIKIKYSRPSMRGRVIFGDLLPYGKLWRTGANEATTLTFGEDVILDGHPLEAGTYALYTVPGKTEWKIILNKGVDNWGPSGFAKSANVAAFSVPVHHLARPQETFRISIEDMTNNSCSIVLAWADVSVRVPVKADNNARIMAYLDKALKGDKPPYAQAAGYYLSTGQKLEDALKYANEAIEQNPKAFYLYWLQARVYQKLGQHEKAVEAAKVAAEKAENTPFAVEYSVHYQDMLRAK